MLTTNSNPLSGGFMFGLRASNRLLAAGFLVAGMTACGGGGAPQEGGEQAAPAGGEAAAPAAVENPARINGTINLTGTPAANAPIDMSEEATCAAKHTTPPTAETIVASNGKLQNVFVYIKDGLTGQYAAPAQAVTIDQNGCTYIPHVTGVQVGQTLEFKNSDGLLHNVKAVPANQPGFNISQPNNMSSPRTFNTAEVMVPIECNVHGWMKAYVGVLDHPYFAVSGADGTFSIQNLPAGTYTVEAWHEKLGTQTQQVTVAANETKDITFDFNAAATAMVPMGKPIDPHGSHGEATHAGPPAGGR
jgi:plastocyanin